MKRQTFAAFISRNSAEVARNCTNKERTASTSLRQSKRGHHGPSFADAMIGPLQASLDVPLEYVLASVRNLREVPPLPPSSARTSQAVAHFAPPCTRWRAPSSRRLEPLAVNICRSPGRERVPCRWHPTAWCWAPRPWSLVLLAGHVLD